MLLLFSGSIPLISPDNAIHGHTADAAAIEVTTVVQGLTCQHAHTADQAIVTAAFLVPADCTHGHTVDQAIIVQVIAPADTTHGHTADTATSASPNVISPVDCVHAHRAEATGVTRNDPPADIEVRLVRPMTNVVLLTPTVNLDMVEVSELVGAP